MPPVYARKIKCPRHYVLKPGGVPFVMERIPSLSKIPESVTGKLNAIIKERGGPALKLWRPKKDKFGRKIQNFKDYIQPWVSAAEMRMRLFNPIHPDCQKCKRCVTA